MSGAPDWLTARPIAHRGLHDSTRGVVENSLAAAEAAVARGFAIECDVQLSADGEAVVFHDSTLDRLTAMEGPVGALAAADLGRIGYRGGEGTIPALPALLALIAGRVPLVCEIKSDFGGDMRLAERVAEIAAGYSGPLAIKSFDPAVIAHLRARPPANTPLGMVAEAHFHAADWPELSEAQRSLCRNFLHYDLMQPDFLSWGVDDLPHATPHLLRRLAGLPVMVWTVRTPLQKRAAREWADQIVFEGEPD